MFNRRLRFLYRALFSMPANAAPCLVGALVLFAADDVACGGVGGSRLVIFCLGELLATLSGSAQMGRRQVVVGAFKRPLQIPKRGACILCRASARTGWVGARDGSALALDLTAITCQVMTILLPRPPPCPPHTRNLLHNINQSLDALKRQIIK